jgi:hypothetical protein
MSPLHRGVLIVAALAFFPVLLLGCPPAQFNLPVLPDYPSTDLDVPEPPEAYRDQLADVVPKPVVLDQAADRVPADLLESAVAVGPIDPPEGPAVLAVPPSMWTALGEEEGALERAIGLLAAPSEHNGIVRLLSERLPFELLRRGVEHVVEPAAMRGIAAEVEEGDGGRGQVRLGGQMGRVALVRPIAGVDYLLYGRVLAADARAQDFLLKYHLDPDALDRYEADYAAFDEALADAESRLVAEVSRYDKEFKEAARAYEEAGGKYEGRKPSDGDGARIRYRKVKEETTSVGRRLQVLRASAVPAEELEEEILARSESERTPIADLRLFIKLLEASTGRTVWAGVLETRDFDIERCVDRLLPVLLDALIPEAPAPVEEEGR